MGVMEDLIQQRGGGETFPGQNMGGYNLGPPPAAVDATAGGAKGGGGTSSVMNLVGTGGYGTMPSGASPYSQALASQASEGNWQSLGTGLRNLGSDQLRTMANQTNIGRQGELEQQQRSMFNTQLQGAQLRNDALIRLLSLFGAPLGPSSAAWRGAGSLPTGGAPGTPGGPGQMFLQNFLGGGATSTPLQKMLEAGGQAQVDAAFRGPGGFLSKIQQLNASQNRFTGGSSLAGEREAIGSRQLGLAKAQVPMHAFAAAAGPQIQAASALAGSEVTPALIARMLTGMAGGGGAG